MIEISCLFYAEDIVILSSSPEGLQKCIECLEKFCESKALEVNTTKTKCMVFQKKSRKYTKYQFSINNKVLDNVTEFTYLGITINAGCSFKPTIQTLSEKAMKAIFALNNKFKFSKMPLNVAMKLFDACIMPILIYGSSRRGSRPVYQVCTNLSDFLGIGSTLNNSHNIFILNLNQFYCLLLFQ